jgi:signal transduction histidine kinase
MAVVGAAAAAVAASTARRGLSPWPEQTAQVVLGVVAGGTLLAVAVVLVDRPAARAAGVLAALAALAWFASSWNDPLVGGTLLFDLGIVLGPLAPVLVGHGVLRSAGRLGTVERTAVLVAYLSAGGVGGLGTALFFDPRAEGCFRCPSNGLLLDGNPGAVTTTTDVAAVLAFAWTVALIACLAGRLVVAGPARRRALGPTFACAAAYLLVAAAAGAHATIRSGTGPNALDGRLWTWQAMLLGVLGLTAAWPRLLLRRTRLRMASAVAVTTTPARDGGASAALGRALGDPSLRLLYPRADGRLLDITGRPRGPQPDGMVLTWLRRRASTLAVLCRPAALDLVDLVETLPHAVGLAIDEELLLVERDDQLSLLEESRRRIVAEADRVRRGLERDLHDGAQQRLVTLALSLRLAQVELAPSPTVLAEAENGVVEALVGLREIAHGIYPIELSDSGLEAALENLAEGAAAPVDLRVRLHRRPPAAVESAGYFAVAYAIRSASPDAAATVEVSERGDRLLLIIESNGELARGSQVRIGDRVAAAGGTCVIHEREGNVRMEVSLTCGS